MIELEPGAVFAGHRIEGIAGRGGMGIVYKATDLRLKREVALKVITPALAADPHFQERFERECELAASIRHPNVIQIFSAGEEGGAAYVTMPFVEGTDLARLIVQSGRQPLDLVAKIAVAVGTALDAAHGRGLVHRDVKPANVLIEQSAQGSEIFLTDFGLMRQVASATRFTATGAVIGTLDYMAPEQIENSTLDARTDVYALGCVLYEALTGSVPFPDTTPPAKLFAHTRKERPSIRTVAPDLPEELDRIVQKGMAVDPDQRYQSAGELGRAVDATVNGPAAGSEATVAGALRKPEASQAGAAAVGAAAGAAGTVPHTPTGVEPAEEATVPLAGSPPPPPTPPPPAGEKPRKRWPLAALGLGIAAVAMAAVIGLVVFGGDDDGGSTDTGTTAANTTNTTDTSGGGDTTGTTTSAVTVPSDYVAFVEGLAGEGGGIEATPGFERRTELVELRGDAVGEAADGQALDELILNRWFRGEAEEGAITFTEDELATEQQTDSTYAQELTNLESVGYEAAGIEYDTEVRLTAEMLYGQGSPAVDMLTNGYEPSDYDEISDLIEKWRPKTGCIDSLAPLSELCSNGPDPQTG